MGMCFDLSGNLYVADFTESTVVKIGPTGTKTTVISSGLQNPTDIKRNPVDGFLYVADCGNQRILKLAADFSFTVVPNTTSFVRLSGLAFDVNGGVLASDMATNKLYRIVSGVSTPIDNMKSAQMFTDSNGSIYTVNLEDGSIDLLSGYMPAITPPSVNPPTQPSLTSSAITDTSFTVSWTGGVGATSYTYKINDNSVTPSTDNGLASQSAIFTGLQSDTAYLVVVSASNEGGTTASSSLPVTTLKTTEPPIIIPRPLVTDTTVRLQWNAPINLNGYEISDYIVTSRDNLFNPRIVARDITTQEITGLTEFAAYTFQVAARYTNGVVSPPATYRTVIPSVIPFSPRIASSTPMTVDGTAVISWEPVANETLLGYAVILTDQNGEEVSNSAYPFATSLEVGGLDTSAVYTCHIYAVNDVGWSEPPALGNPVVLG